MFADSFSGKYGNLTWMFTSGILVISGSGDMLDWVDDATTPTWRVQMNNTRQVKIEEGVTSIGKGAFSYFTNMQYISIPSTVRSIGNDSFYNCVALTSINLPSKVTSIGEHAFDRCNTLSSITIPESVTSIGSGAFYDCVSLETVKWNAKNCASRLTGASQAIVTSFTFGDEVQSIPTGLCEGMKLLKSITLPASVTSIGENAFNGCSGLQSINIPAGVTSIGERAFYGCSGISSITIPTSVKSIEGMTFYGCTGLKTIVWNAKNCSSAPFSSSQGSITSFTFGSEVESIPANICMHMTNLTSITIPENVTSIGASAFNNCTGLKTVVWNAKNCSDAPFRSSQGSITSFTFGSKVESIPANLCMNMNNLTSITIPENVTSIGEDAFYGCSGLKTIVWNAKNCSDAPFSSIANSITLFSFGDGLESIPANLCQGMTQLTYISIPSGVKSIGNQAFDGCSGLRTVYIPENVTALGEKAFSGCSGLSYIKCEGAPAKCGSDCFLNANKYTTLFVPLLSAMAYKTAEGWNYFINISPSSENGTCGSNLTWSFASGVLTIEGTGDMEALNPMPWDGFRYFIDKVVIKKGVTSICASAFKNCTKMTSIVLPNGITSVGQYAFSGCSSLTSLSLDEVEAIPTGLCANCTALENIYIGVATGLASDAFSGCSSLNYITASNENIAFSSSLGVLYNKDYTQLVKCPPAKGSYTFRSSVTSILPSAFSGCAAPFSVACDKDTPPALTSGNNLFADAIGTINVYVPEARIDAYKAAWGTKNCQYSATQSGTCTVDGLNYEYYSDGTAKVIASTVTGDLVIPATFIYNSKTYTVTEIGNAFYNCAGLTSVTIPVSVTKISLYAFQKCTGLQTVYCKAYNAVPSLSTGAFYDQPADLLIYVPVVLLDEYKTKWHGMTNIQPEPIVIGGLYYSVDVEDQNATVMQHPDGAGEYNPLLNVEIPKSINIYGMSFSVDSIGKDAFYGCDEIQSISLPNSVVYIDEYAFYECSALTSLYIPDGVTGIGQRAFWGCSGLTTITIPENVVTIGDWAFRSCTGFQFITCKAVEPPTCIYKCFSGVDKSITLYVPYESLDAYHNADEWNEFNIQPFDAPVGIDQINAQTGKYGTVKVLRNGQIFILHNGKTYTLQGQVVKQ